MKDQEHGTFQNLLHHVIHARIIECHDVRWGND